MPVDIDKLGLKNFGYVLSEVSDKFVFHRKISDWANQYLAGHMDHYRCLFSQISDIYEIKNIKYILDIGSVPGHMAAILKFAGLNIDAVDIEPERSRELFESMDICYHKVDVESEPLPFPDNTYDLVIFSEILEHLRKNPLKAMAEIHRVLKPDGVCLLSTPQITPLMRWRFLFGHDYQDDIISEYAKLETIGHMGHIRLYSRDEVERILKHFNFSVIKIKSGGKLSGKNTGFVGTLLRKLVPDKMRVQLYVWAEKPA
ncbi:MAG: class I SAM-dependent methyltransferase [Desulfobacteraceae bacterium]|nr:class I SAM-dependent methyltransferase [Desulfobacteraceae bacterium]